MIVAKLTAKQADSIKGLEYKQDSYFNPIQDNNNNWVISIEEVEQCNMEWIKGLKHIEYEPKIEKIIY